MATWGSNNYYRTIPNGTKTKIKLGASRESNVVTIPNINQSMFVKIGVFWAARSNGWTIGGIGYDLRDYFWA